MKSRVHRVLLVTVLIVALVAVIGIYLSHDGWNPGSARPSVVEKERERLPDLFIHSVNWTLEYYGAVTFTVWVGNCGNAAADATMLGLKYWGRDGRVWHAIKPVDPIPVNGWAVVVFKGVTPDVAGVNSFVFFADAEERLAELDEGNNESRTFTIEVNR